MVPVMRFKSSFIFWIWVVLVGLVAVYVLVELLSPAGVSGLPTGKPAKTGPGPGSEESAWTSEITQKNVLGLENPKKTPESEAGSEGDPGSWSLLGTITGKRPVALVSMKGEVKTILSGEKVGGWTLAGIHPDKVVWQRDGDLREVPLEQERAPDLDFSPSKTNKVRLSKGDAAAALGNPAELLQQALFKPYRRGNEIKGFRVSNIKEDSILKKIGLENNDILLRINGRRVDGPAELLKAYGGAGKGKAVTMDVKRGKDVFSVLLDIE